MKHGLLLLVTFVFSSVVQVRIVDAKDYVIPAEDPQNCIKNKFAPCAVSTGDRPRMFLWEKHRWELDRNLVMSRDGKGVWNIYQGMLVLESHGSQNLHTPFADIEVGRSKVMIHVLENKVRILSLDGEGIRVRGKGNSSEQYLVPGFQNWYGGVNNGETDSGVASVIDFESYAQDRSKFFLNYELGYIKELQKTASIVKWAAKMASQMHRDLVERKMASLEEKHQKKLAKKKQKVHFNKYLRQLFLQKIRYDY